MKHISEIHFPSMPLDKIRFEVDRAKEEARTAGLSGHDRIEKDLSQRLASLSRTFSAQVADNATKQVETMSRLLRDARDRGLRSGEPLERVIKRVDSSITELSATADSFAVKADEARTASARAREQYETTRRQRASLSGGWFLVLVYAVCSLSIYYFLLRRSLRALAFRSIDHLARAETKAATAEFYDALANANRNLLKGVEALRSEMRAWVQDAELYGDRSRTDRIEQEARHKFRGVLPDQTGMSELEAEVTACSQELVGSVFEELCASGQVVTECVDVAVDRALRCASLPNNLTQELERIGPQRRDAKMGILHQESQPPVIVKYLEAPLPERFRIRIIGVPDGDRFPFLDHVCAGGGEIDTIVIESPTEDEMFEIHYEEGLCAAQIPLLRQLRERTPGHLVENARFIQNSASKQFDLAGARMDSEDAALRRLVLGCRLGLINCNGGAFYRTSESNHLNGAKGRLLAQGFDETLESLRHSEIGAAIDTAIENALASQGADDVIAALEAESNRNGFPVVHAERCARIIDDEIRLLKRVLLTS